MYIFTAVNERTCQRCLLLSAVQHCYKQLPCILAPIHGFWSPWSGWNMCSAQGPCTAGYQTRFRICDSPTPHYGGHICQGFPMETRMCVDQNCMGEYYLLSDVVSPDNVSGLYGTVQVSRKRVSEPIQFFRRSTMSKYTCQLRR